MGFQDTIDKIADDIKKAVKDLASLEVVTYKGEIAVKANQTITNPFESIVDASNNNVTNAKCDMKVVACTHCDFDGDMKIYYDKNITREETDAHNQMVEAGTKNRQAIVDMVIKAVGSAIKP